MQQLTQQLKSGKMEILEVPFPALGPKQVLVRNHFSVISAGTEGKTVTDARKGYIAKAKSRQKEVKQVIELIKTQGLLSTYKMVMNKLEAPSALGYSTAGEIIAVGEGVKGFRVGDQVACGGATAVHADVVAVPVNLCVKVAEEVSLEEAAFTTIAAIAIQGIRQADLHMGEYCVITGLGLIGRITAQVLEASGIIPIGIDIDVGQVQAAREGGMKYAFERNMEGIEEKILTVTNGHGADAIIITAGTSSTDPVEFAGVVARRKGKVVIVGAVPTGFSRTNYYKKELDLRMSSSYGPGRYDPQYEEKGMDYPIGYVRWTENRNMQAYIQLLESGKLQMSSLISHIFPLETAPEAYQMILERSEPFSGILIAYAEKEPEKEVVLKHKEVIPSEPNIGFIGAGSFAQNILLPQLKDKANFIGIATARGNNSRYVADKYGFSYCAEKAEQVIEDIKINTLFITTRHDSHAKYVMEGIQAGKHVFVEKPLAMNEEELEQIRALYNEQKESHMVMVGFNRRFSPMVQKVRALFDAGQSKSIQIRINAGMLPPDHWVNDPETGGGRIIGEACHFIDLAMFLAGAGITSVAAHAMDDSNSLDNTVVINLQFANGSVASISYFSNGNKKMPKEYMEVFCGGTAVVIDDFRTLTIYGESVKKQKYKGQDKGHRAEVLAFLDAIRNGKSCPIPFEESHLSMLATYKVLQSIREKRTIEIEPEV